jgi:hypothetical protein
VDQDFLKIVNEMKTWPEVEALLLAGSHGRGTADKDSDYDLYVYTNAEIPLERRKQLFQRTCREMEINNQYWETEDDGVLNSGVEIELIYRSLDWLEGVLAPIVEGHQAWGGYTTCFWSNLKYSQILYDARGQAAALQQRFDIAYPEKLRENIISKNRQLLSRCFPSLRGQIKKALGRDDRVSVHHRLTEWLASYFDILFALNRSLHPGEKKLLAYSQNLPLLPEDHKTLVLALIEGAGRGIRIFCRIWTS